jgi:hypothetical protein
VNVEPTRLRSSSLRTRSWRWSRRTTRARRRPRRSAGRRPPTRTGHSRRPTPRGRRLVGPGALEQQPSTGQSGSSSARIALRAGSPAGRARSRRARAGTSGCRRPRAADAEVEGRRRRRRGGLRRGRRTRRCSSVARASDRARLVLARRALQRSTPPPPRSARSQPRGADTSRSTSSGTVTVPVVGILPVTAGRPRATGGDPAERPRGPSQLRRDDRPVIHRPGAYAARAASPGFP